MINTSTQFTQRVCTVLSLCFLSVGLWVMASYPALAGYSLQPYNLSTHTDSLSTSSQGVGKTIKTYDSSEDTDLELVGVWFINSGVETDEDSSYQVYQTSFNDLMFDGNNVGVSGATSSDLNNSDPYLWKKPLAYPNPFVFSQGAELRYIIGMDMDLKFIVYDIFGHKVFEKHLPAGSAAATGQKVSTLTLDEELFEMELSAGVYFYFLLHDGKVLKSEDGTIKAKGKFAIVP